MIADMMKKGAPGTNRIPGWAIIYFHDGSLAAHLRIRTKLEADESLRAVLNADNPRDAKVYKFNQVLDRLLLEFVHTKLDLYKKLTEPKVNEMLKRQWFEVLAGGMLDEDAVQRR